MTGFFDSHSHLQDPAFAGVTEAVLIRARAAGVTGIAVLGYDLQSSRAAIELSQTAPSFLFPAAGIHPHDAARVTREQLAGLAETAGRREVVAVGETGLDFCRNLSPVEAQEDLLRFHLDLALSLGKPVSVHSRSAEDSIVGPLSTFAARWTDRWPGRVPGVMHCFGGSTARALEFVSLGFMVSIACVVTYPSADRTRDLAARLPLGSLLVETDSPYLPPQHSRGKRNEPSFVVEAAQSIADVREESLEEIAAATNANAANLFRLQTSVLTATVNA